MISIKKYLEMNEAVVPVRPPSSETKPVDLLSAVLESYRLALLAMGKSGEQACPALGVDLQENIASLEKRLAPNTTAALARETEEKVEEQLQRWGTRAADYFKSATDDVKELLIVMARTAESVGKRDQRYAGQFTKFTVRLQAIANFEDLANIRASLVAEAAELKSCVDQMAQDSQEVVAQLRAEVCTYESKLKAVEQLAVQDALTGLANRRYVEGRIGLRVEEKQTFCVAMLDLNKLKRVNDTQGHLAGDEVLRQFSQELRSNSRPTDIVGRWGGDEFILVLDCDLAGAESQVDRLRKWVFGEYAIPLRPEKAVAKIHVDAAIGLAQWMPGETMRQLLERADAAMYKQKEVAHHKGFG